jgi:hypothetical protein
MAGLQTPWFRFAVPLAVGLSLFLCAGCAQTVSYADSIRTGKGGRSLFVRAPANFGEATGFIAGLPVSLVALPVTLPIHEIEKERDPLRADRVSTVLFPSWGLSKLMCAAIGGPFDLLEYGAWRAWTGGATRTEAEQEAIERVIDADLHPRYPVEVLYPPAAADDDR